MTKTATWASIACINWVSLWRRDVMWVPAAQRQL